jgi:hypothetical protein
LFDSVSRFILPLPPQQPVPGSTGVRNQTIKKCMKIYIKSVLEDNVEEFEEQA